MNRVTLLPLAAAIGCAPVAPAPVKPTQTEVWPTPSGPRPDEPSGSTPTQPDGGVSGGRSFYSTALADVDRYHGVPYPSREPSKCSPKQPDDVKWRGIVIQGQRRVEFTPGKRVASGRFAVVPVCGFYMLDLEKLMDGQPMQVVVTDTASKRVMRWAVIDTDDGTDVPPPDRKPPPREERGGCGGGGPPPPRARPSPRRTRSR